jgi:4-hydroxy-tetrahydrodipicolinate reductase
MNTNATPADTPIRILLHGATGRMGQSVLRLAAEQAQYQLVGAVSQRVSQRVIDGIPQFSASELHGAPPFDVAIDFSLPGAFNAILSTCLEHDAGLVSGTTGLGEADVAAMTAAAARLPIVWSSNFSLGVAVLASLVERAARALPGWDCDIIEAHHTAKRDAPSGTALSLGQVIGTTGATPRYASIRAGDIIGEHTVQFATDGERLELTHRASNRDIFARGALHAAGWLAHRQPGLYTLRDVVG